MNTDKIKTLVGVLGALFGIYNLAAARFGWACIQFDDAAMTTAITTLWTLAFTCYSTWKNCNITPVAKELQNFKDAFTSKDTNEMARAINNLIAMRKAILDEQKGEQQ